jgi:hypothetical protein
MKSFTVAGVISKQPGWETKQGFPFSPHSAYAIQYSGNVGA